MNPINAPQGYEKTQIDDDNSVGFSPDQVFAFISSAMRSSGERGCNCSVAWFIFEIDAKESQKKRNRDAVKRGQNLLVQMATTLLVDHVGRARNRYSGVLNSERQ